MFAMPARRRTRAQPLAAKAAELAFAVPQVVGHRLTRMALAGARPSARDQREFRRMGQEKVHAFWQSWFAMGWAFVSTWQRAWLAMLQGARVPLQSTLPALDVLAAKGLAPIHRRATANARRLARTPLR
jgi:hypothetical protein